MRPLQDHKAKDKVKSTYFFLCIFQWCRKAVQTCIGDDRSCLTSTKCL